MVRSYLCQSKVRRIACSVHHVNTFTKITQRVSFDRNKNVGNVLYNSKVVFSVENDHVYFQKDKQILIFATFLIDHNSIKTLNVDNHARLKIIII